MSKYEENHIRESGSCNGRDGTEVTMDEELRVKANAPLVKMLELAK